MGMKNLTLMLCDMFVTAWDCKFACCSSDEQKDVISESETKCTLVDSAATPVEFVTGMLSATTSRSSYPTWGIEKVPIWMRPVTLKKSIQHTIEIDAIDLWVFTASAAVGYMLAAVFSRSKCPCENVQLEIANRRLVW
ncbi:hypothetical protein Tco_1427902 [Tanacetum coccineum]